MVPESSKPTVTYLSIHISYIFLIFLLIQKFVSRAFVVHSDNMPSHDHVMNNIVSQTLDQYWVLGKMRG